MKLKYYIVEHISYVSNDGYPGVGTDPRTQERIHFSSKKKAKRFIKRFMRSDPDFVKMWIAHITLHTVKIKVQMVKFPSEWAKNVISKKERESDAYKEAPISKKVSISEGEWGDDILGVTDKYWQDTHLREESPEQLEMWEKKKPDTFQA